LSAQVKATDWRITFRLPLLAQAMPNARKSKKYGNQTILSVKIVGSTKLKPHLRNSPHSFLIMGNNCLKQLSFGARSLFFPVVPVVSNLIPDG